MDSARADKVIESMTMFDKYIHGYRTAENARLHDQAGTLSELLHSDTGFPPGSAVLEVGCGVGAQTVAVAERSPGAALTAIDLSAESLAAARKRAHDAGLRDVAFAQADVYTLPRPDGPLAAATFDHVFVCFLLEHLPRPVDALRRLRTMLRPGGTITVIEGDHGSTYFHPDSPAARDVSVSPRMVYVDASRPELADGFIRKTFTAMIAGIREPALAAGLIAADRFDAGIADLLRTAEPDGVFCYTFFKATARALNPLLAPDRRLSRWAAGRYPDGAPGGGRLSLCWTWPLGP
jgi:ubiquinone/menaquinone biosynthesis C-methylase UbiE